MISFTWCFIEMKCIAQIDETIKINIPRACAHKANIILMPYNEQQLYC